MERPDGTYPVLPERAEPCVWMAAGLLSYRLCDRGYDCEHCPLDAAIRGTPATPNQEIVEGSMTAPTWEIRDGLQYHASGAWVDSAAPGRLRWGLDGLTARLLDRMSSVILPAPGTELVQGEVACWVVDDGEPLPLRTPVSGAVARVNAAVQRDPSLVARFPYDAGWLLETERTGDPAALRELTGANERRARAAGQIRRFHRAASGYLRTDQDLGATSRDGGERLADMRSILGRDRYHRLVLSLLR
jgi:glycine cleavage system H lipoate-binding protein